MPKLEDLFNTKKQNIYDKFSPSETQYVSVKPDTKNASQFAARDALKAIKQLKLPSETGVLTSNSRVKDDTQSIPIVSTARDAIRVFKFLDSPNGRLFIAKQLLLQTANTFTNTKIYNPTSPLLSTVPFIHPSRHVIQSLLRPNTPGLLQNNTTNNIASTIQVTGALRAVRSGNSSLFRGATTAIKSFASAQLKNAANIILPISQNYYSSRPEYIVFNLSKNTDYLTSKQTGPFLFEPQPLSQRGTVKLSTTANLSNTVISAPRAILLGAARLTLNKVIPKLLRGKVPNPAETGRTPYRPGTFEEEALKFKRSFYTKLEDKYKNIPSIRFQSPYIDGTSIGGQTDRLGARVSIESKKTGIQDDYNTTTNKVTVDRENTINYNNIIRDYQVQSPAGLPPNPDIIKFIFREADRQSSNPVQFRALLSSIKESIKPQFNEQQYVGRTERFVTYAGAKRNVSLMFNVVAFSQQEIEGMWSRINYLSGLAFPKGQVNGFMVPPLFKMTIGNLYENQPCYIESLDYDFLDESITFDTINEIPFAVNVTMQLSLLEKRTKFYDSPFYKITEQLAETQLKRGVEETNARISAAAAAAQEERLQFEAARDRIIEYFDNARAYRDQQLDAALAAAGGRTGQATLADIP